jgi:hypothetical protein
MKPVDFFKPMEKCMATLKKSLQTLGSIAAISGMIAAAPVPAAQGSNPCAPKSSKMCAQGQESRKPLRAEGRQSLRTEEVARSARDANNMPTRLSD